MKITVDGQVRSTIGKISIAITMTNEHDGVEFQKLAHSHLRAVLLNAMRQLQDVDQELLTA